MYSPNPQKKISFIPCNICFTLCEINTAAFNNIAVLGLPYKKISARIRRDPLFGQLGRYLGICKKKIRYYFAQLFQLYIYLLQLCQYLEWSCLMYGGVKISRVFEFLDLQESTESDRRYIKKNSDNFCAKLKEKWINSRRILNKFLIKNSTWLKGDVLFPKLNIFSWNAQFQVFRR